MCVFFMHVVPLMHVFQLVHLLYLNALKAIGVSVIQLVPDHVYDWCDVKRLQWSKWIATATFFSYTCSPSSKFKTPPRIPYINSDEGYILLFLRLGAITKQEHLKKTEKTDFSPKTGNTHTWNILLGFICRRFIIIRKDDC